MAHERKRYAAEKLKQLMRFSPIVGVFGHRQVGKTTLLSRHVKDYATLDVRAQLDRAQADPQAFLASASGYPFGIDEAQLAPDLFPSLKEHVRIHRRPGQFVLSGSVRFTSRRAIRESLTGRIVHLELLPFTQAEMDERPMPEGLFHALRGSWNSIPPGTKNADGMVSRYLQTGGLPGVCFIRSAALRAERFESQLETLLERDLRLVVESRLPYSTLRNVLVNLAITQGEPLDWTGLSRRTRVSAPTLRQLLRAFEAIFLIRVLRTEGTEKRPVVFLEDQGEATHLSGRPLPPLVELTRYLFAQIRSPLRLLDSSKQGEIFQYRTRGGAHLPLALRLDGKVLGMIPILESSPGRQAVGSATSFLNHYPDSRVIFVHPGPQSQILSKTMAVLSVDSLS